MPKALITGITGQDGSYLAELLLEKNYEVVGLVRRSSNPNKNRIADIGPDLNLQTGDLLDADSLARILGKEKPDEIYNLAAQSFVTASFENPIYTGEVTGLGVARLLEAYRREAPEARFFQASSSEMFGNPSEVPQKESTPFHPRSPYGAAKTFAHFLAQNYREAYGLHISCGIMFNHESPRRGPEFVTRKITQGIARLAVGGWEGEPIKLGNTDVKRDWSHAKDMVRGMHLMLQQETPGDYVLASGENYSIADFISKAVRHAEKLCPEGADKSVKISERDESLFRPSDVNELKGNAYKATSKLKWTPEYSFDDLVHEMVEQDIELARQSAL